MLGTIAAQAAERFGDRPAMITPSGWDLGFRALHRLSDEAAVGLARRGVREGSRVVLSLDSGPEYAVAYVALAKLGAVAAGVSPALAPAERAQLVAMTEPALVLATPGAAPGLPPEVDLVEVAAAERAEDVLRDLREPGQPPRLAPDPERHCAIVFTSGTTGSPKGALFATRHLAATLAAEQDDPWAAGEHVLSGTQFAHVGFMLRLHAYLAMGTTLCLLQRWRAEEALALIERYRMPAMNGVSAQIALMLQVPHLEDLDLRSVRRIVTGGGPSTPALVEEATRRLGAIYTARYSMTESGGMGTATSPEGSVEEHARTVGRPRPGLELQIGEPGHPLPAGEVGEVCLRGPTVMLGYWNDPVGTAETLVDGWLRTGDLGHLDDAGRLRLVGRRKEMYIRGGYNVYPQEVEAVLSTHPAVGTVVVVPRADAVMGEVGVAVVVPRPGTPSPTLAELRDHGQDRLARYKLPEVLRTVEALPVTSMHKVDRRALERAVAEPVPGEERLRPR